MSYIPLGHNTPTVVLTSYTSNYSYTPLFHSTIGQQEQTPNQFGAQLGFLSSSYKAAPGNPTTNVSMDSANPNLAVHTPLSLYRNSLVGLAPIKSDIQANLLPSGSFGARPFSQMARMPSDRSVHQLRHDSTASATVGSVPQNAESGSAENPDNFQQEQPQLQTPGFLPNLPTEPDHYMTYKEYLEILNKRDASATEETGYEEHLNIVDYPVNELITMLACLLTKIIEANDKLHPNHFDNTIAIRQKLKEDKKLRRMPREQQQAGDGDSMSTGTSHEDHQDGLLSDDEEDELKNRYLANVLAFHGTNIPGISLHAYLTRVLKYCPVTNEVFLSLLVYFDRIAKKANNLRKKKKENDDDNDELEQLFVMDSYNIHRLIILGITVSSKFFSDIFYKNLRYAKVGGLPLEELNYLELQFLLLLDFKLMISVEDLQNYGDLLLKFWKREQLANELVGAKPSE